MKDWCLKHGFLTFLLVLAGMFIADSMICNICKTYMAVSAIIGATINGDEINIGGTVK